MRHLSGKDMPGYTVNIARQISVQTGLTSNEKPRALVSVYGRIQILFHRGNSGNSEGNSMAYELDPSETVEFKEILMANTIQIDTMFQLLIQKGYFTEVEFLEKMKDVSVDYRLGGNA